MLSLLLLSKSEADQVLTTVLAVTTVAALLVAASLGERHQAWRISAYVFLGSATFLFGAVVLVNDLLGPAEAAPLRFSSPGRVIAGAVLQITAAWLAGLSLLPPVRRWLARVLPDFHPESPVHAIAASLYVLVLLSLLAQQVTTDQLQAIAASRESPGLLFIIGLNQLPFVVVSVAGVGLFTRRSLKGAVDRLGLFWPGWRWMLASLGVAILLVVFGTVFDQIMARLTPEQTKTIEQVSNQLLRNVSGVGPAIVLSLAAGLGEEILFRGALLPRIGNPASALLFAALHAQYAISLATLEIFILGLVLGLLRRRAGTTGCIVAHGGYDLILLLLPILAGQVPHR